MPLINYLRAHPHEQEADWLGRRNAQFYGLFIKRNMEGNYSFAPTLRERGFPI